MLQKIDDKWVVTGFYTPLHNVLKYFTEQEIMVDALNNIFSLPDWDENTSNEQKLEDISQQKNVIDNSDLKRYLLFKDNEIHQVELKEILNYIKRVEQLFIQQAKVTNELLIAQSKTIGKITSSGKYITLKTINEAFKYKDKALYSVGSLRNMISKEKFGDVELGYLDIFNMHLTLLKRGNKWVTPQAHWLEERQKIDYDFLNKIRKRSKNLSNM